MQPTTELVEVDRGWVVELFRADRRHQLVSSALDQATSEQLAEIQVRGWLMMLDEVVEPAYLGLVVDGEPRAGAVLGGAVGRRIVWIGAAPGHRRRGHARELLGAICTQADHEHQILDLQVDRANQGAIALYSAAGFRTAGSEQTTDLLLVREPRRSTR